MDFTREPIIETVITPKEGHKLVVRSSKAAGQEEFFVDAVEIVAFGPALFFRSVEKPKAFLVPTSDYEILEVREARMVLKHVGLERAIKIGGGKEPPHRGHREVIEKELPPPVAVPVAAAIAAPADAPIAEDKSEGRFERKRERRRHYRRRRGREEGGTGQWSDTGEENTATAPSEEEREKIPLVPPREHESKTRESLPISSSILSSLLPPPPMLVSDNIALYREDEKFKGAFFLNESNKEEAIEPISQSGPELDPILDPILETALETAFEPSPVAQQTEASPTEEHEL